MSGVQGMHRSAESRRTARDRIWQSMRILRQFRLPDLVATSEAGENNCLKYTRALCAAGIVRVVQPKASGIKGGHIAFSLVRDLGPKAPRLRSDGTTYDPNSQTVLPGGVATQSRRAEVTA